MAQFSERAKSIRTLSVANILLESSLISVAPTFAVSDCMSARSAAADDLSRHESLIDILGQGVGRLIFNGNPTGVDAATARRLGSCFARRSYLQEQKEPFHLAGQ
jgi:hypothetical protein